MFFYLYCTSDTGLKGPMSLTFDMIIAAFLFVRRITQKVVAVF